MACLPSHQWAAAGGDEEEGVCARTPAHWTCCGFFLLPPHLLRRHRLTTCTWRLLHYGRSSLCMSAYAHGGRTLGREGRACCRRTRRYAPAGVREACLACGHAQGGGRLCAATTAALRRPLCTHGCRYAAPLRSCCVRSSAFSGIVTACGRCGTGSTRPEAGHAFSTCLLLALSPTLQVCPLRLALGVPGWRCGVLPGI